MEMRVDNVQQCFSVRSTLKSLETLRNSLSSLCLFSNPRLGGDLQGTKFLFPSYDNRWLWLESERTQM